MRAFLSSGRIVLSLLSLLGPVAANAQSAAPVPGQPISLLPQLPPASANTPPSTNTLTTTPLAAPNPDEAGALPAGIQALPANLWAGAGRPVVDALLSQIVPTTSPALQDLAFRLLASPATAPAGDTAPGGLVAIRAEQLSTFGHPDTALQLLRTVPPAQLVGDANQVLVELMFLTLDTQSACAAVKSRDHSVQGMFWDEADVTCNLLSGQSGSAQIGFDMLNEDGSAAGFSALVSRAAGYDVPLPQELPPPQPLALALVAHDGKGLPPSILVNGSIAVLRAVALTPGLPDEARLIAAEKAAAFGALPPDRLAEAYLALPLDDDEKAQPMTAALHANNIRARAILFNAARDATDPAARAEYLTVFLEKCAGAGLYSAAIRAAEPLLIAIPATPDLRSDAIDLARALYALDLPDAARPWFDLLPSGGQQQFLPLASIVGGAKPPDWGNDVLLDPNISDPDMATAAVGRAALAVQLLTALGRPPPDSATLSLLAAGGALTWDSPAAGPPLFLSVAAERRQPGGVILGVLSSLGSAGVTAPAPLLVESVAALHQLGFETEARHLAIDAAIAAGL